MTREDIRSALSAGKMLIDLLPFGPGQDCEIFKSDKFSAGDDVIYIPDVLLNEIPIYRKVFSQEELEYVLSHCYTGKDVVEECGGDESLAERLFWYCDWQNPSSALAEVADDEEE